MPNIHKYTVYDTGLILQQQIQHLRDSMSASLFAANYEMKHIADSDAMFKNANWLADTEENNKLIFDGEFPKDQKGFSKGSKYDKKNESYLN